jgi:hypothetical protein
MTVPGLGRGALGHLTGYQSRIIRNWIVNSILEGSNESKTVSFVWRLSMLDQGLWAEVKVGSEHLRLFSEHNALGVQASVYNVNAKIWIAPSEAVEDIEQGKDRAAAHAMTYLLRVADAELPPLSWKKSRSA